MAAERLRHRVDDRETRAPHDRGMRRRFLISPAMMAAAAVITLVTAGATTDTALPATVDGPTVATIGAPMDSRPIAPGFLGLSLEYYAVTPYAGSSPAAVNPVLVQLIRNLAPGQSPVLRIGGDSTDRTWWPVPGMPRPGGVRFTLTRRWLRVVRALAQATGARLVFGVNLEADSEALSAAEAQAIVAGIPRNELDALELGNEPELYAKFKWYAGADGRRVYARAAGWEFSDYVHQYSQFSSVLPLVHLAGPTSGIPNWIRDIPQFVAAEPQVKLVTVHRYPLQRCYTRPSSPMYPTIAHLLAQSSSRGLANSVATDASLAHSRGLTLRVDELNSVACSGEPGISDVFASALWALDTAFQMARIGVDGVNIHTFPGASYEPFTVSRPHGHWQSFVEPEYYGLMMFAQAAPPGSRLLSITLPAAGGVRAWATRATNGTVRAVLMNDTPVRRIIALRAPGTPPGTVAHLERLLAPSITARRGITLSGQSFGSQTDTGRLAGGSSVRALAPIKRDYVLAVPGYSAAMLTLTNPAQRRP